MSLPESLEFLVVGQGGHARVLLEIVQVAHPGWSAAGSVERVEGVLQNPDTRLAVLGIDRDLPRLFAGGIRHALLAVGAVGDNRRRERLFGDLIEIGFHVLPAIHGSATLSRSASFGEGVQVLPRVVVNANAKIADNVILNTGAIIEHDCVVASHVHVAPGAILTAGVVVETGAHIGAGAVVRQGVRIGARGVVGSGAVVLNDVAVDATVVGVPARPLQRRT